MRKSAIEFCKTIAKLYGVRLRIYDRNRKWGGGTGGGAYTRKDHTIRMWVGGYNHNVIVSVFFHELAHAECVRLGKYPAFHKGRTQTQRSRAFLYHGLQAERYVDAMGKRMCAQWLGRSIKWRKAYSTKGEDFAFKVNQVLPHYRWLKARGALDAKKKRQAGLNGSKNRKAA